MSLDIAATIGFVLWLIALGFAAMRWGVDSRFIDVRSDF
jgi:hypothetical protein